MEGIIIAILIFTVPGIVFGSLLVFAFGADERKKKKKEKEIEKRLARERAEMYAKLEEYNLIELSLNKVREMCEEIEGLADEWKEYHAMVIEKDYSSMCVSVSFIRDARKVEDMKFSERYCAYIVELDGIELSDPAIATILEKMLDEVYNHYNIQRKETGSHPNPFYQEKIKI